MSNEGMRLNVTLCLSPAPALLAAKTDAYIVSPFIRRLDDTPVIESAKAGAHIGAMPFKVLEMLFNHPLTDKGLEQFLKDYNKVFHQEPVGSR